jgi:hypothetical protein
MDGFKGNYGYKGNKGIKGTYGPMGLEGIEGTKVGNSFLARVPLLIVNKYSKFKMDTFDNF